ncbi:MAG: hypothetical protein KDA32_04765 [Phycisphaerales bacterium]|nr:hypothetical protein [Phycisphaerales bacterium]
MRYRHSLGWLAFALSSSAIAQDHPRLLIQADDVPRLRHECGVEQLEGRDAGGFGAGAEAFRALRAYFTTRLSIGDDIGEIGALPGELAAAAFLHVIEPADSADIGRIRLLNNVLRQSLLLADDPLEHVIALDWCWDALEPETRQLFLDQIRERAAYLAASDSPADPQAFRTKLLTLAAVLAIDDNDVASPSWLVMRREALEAARKYFEVAFPAYIEMRGLVPGSPSAAADEELCIVLAIELADRLDPELGWKKFGPHVARLMEHYLLVGGVDASVTRQFLHDDAGEAPLTPVPAWRRMWPLTAQLLAARTRAPSAATMAFRVNSLAVRGGSEVDRLWRWARLALPSDAPLLDMSRIPAARNLDGAIVFRGAAEYGSPVIWVDSASFHLRRRQHFDAGNTLLRAFGADLLVDAGDNIRDEAVADKRGEQHLGDRDRGFEFEQFYNATIAHNCMLFQDPARAYHWEDHVYEPMGGQRPHEGPCEEFPRTLEDHDRRVARLLAFGAGPDVGYAALDLKSAYDDRTVESYTREYVYVLDRALIIIDRTLASKPRVTPAIVWNIPTQPTIGLAHLATAERLAGNADDAGVWDIGGSHWLRWTNAAASLWLKRLAPAEGRITVVGGPAREIEIQQGPFAGRKYRGGGPDTFERLISLSRFGSPRNAWYRLGGPTVLGSEVGRQKQWGRIEIEGSDRVRRNVFVTVLITDRAAVTREPEVAFEMDDDQLTINLDLDGRAALIRAPADLRIGGVVSFAARPTEPFRLPERVMPNPAWPTAK